MDDIWGEAYCVTRVGKGGDLDHEVDSYIAIEDIPNLNIQSPIPTISSSATTSTKTNSEYAESISPSLPFHNDSPNDVKSSLPSPIFSSQPTESIAQMLEYMRACNGSQVPLERPSDYIDEERNSYRKRERQDDQLTKGRSIDDREMQKLPNHNVMRSKSQGSEARLNHPRTKVESMQHRVRPRSKTIVGSWNRDEVPGVIAISPETRYREGHRSSNRSDNPSSSSFFSLQDHQEHSAWYAPSCNAPHLFDSASSWSNSAPSPSRNTSHDCNPNNLSFAEFLKLPEGAAWTQYFRTKYAMSQTDETDAQTQVVIPQSCDQVEHSQRDSRYSPQRANLASIMNLQDTPNQALVQAFQTAFVLGMQQLGIAEQFQSNQGNFQARLSPSPRDHQQQSTHALQPSRVITAETYPAFHFERSDLTSTLITPRQPVRNLADGDSSAGDQSDSTKAETYQKVAVLESLIHDINHQRPDEQEVSLDQFLAFVATIVETNADEQGEKKECRSQSQAEIKVKKEVSEIVKSPRQLDKSRSQRLKMGDLELCNNKRKGNRRRTFSLSSQLSGTQLPDVVEEERSDEIEMHIITKGPKGPVAKWQSIKAEAKCNKMDSNGDLNIVIAPPKKGFNKTRRTKSTSPLASFPNKFTKVERDGSNKLAERRLRRRESHNAVERRRRDHINERIAELASLLPESMLLDAIAASTGGGTTPHIDLSLFARRPIAEEALILGFTSTDVTISETTKEEESRNDIEIKANALAPVHSSSETLALAQSKPNKGIILSKSVDYIKHLHEFCSILRCKQKEMQKQINELKTLKSNELEIQSKVESQNQQMGEDFAMNDATPPSNLSSWLDHSQKDESQTEHNQY